MAQWVRGRRTQPAPAHRRVGGRPVTRRVGPRSPDGAGSYRGSILPTARRARPMIDLAFAAFLALIGMGAGLRILHRLGQVPEHPLDAAALSLPMGLGLLALGVLGLGELG